MASRDYPQQVFIPFNSYFEKLLVDGIKTATSRNKRYGNEGDSFVIFGRCFILTTVSKKKLNVISRDYYREEGFNSKQEFIDFWNMLHPKKKYQPDQLVWFHRFQSTANMPFHIHEFNRGVCTICGYFKSSQAELDL